MWKPGLERILDYRVFSAILTVESMTRMDENSILFYYFFQPIVSLVCGNRRHDLPRPFINVVSYLVYQTFEVIEIFKKICKSHKL